MSTVRASLAVLGFVLTGTILDAAIPQRDSNGAVIVPSSSTFHVKFTPNNSVWQHEAWRNAIATINAVPGSNLRIIEDAITSTPPNPVLNDGINSMAVMSTTDWDNYSPDQPFVLACVNNECDVWFNVVDWNIVGGTGSYAYDRYYDAESLALSALLMMAARLDDDVRFERILYSHPPYGVGRWQLTTDETTWLQAGFSAAPAAQMITGMVKRGASPIKYAYVCAALTGGGDDICVTTAADGSYTLRVPAGGTYRVVVSPLTTNPGYLFSTVYRGNNPTNVNFLATSYATAIVIGAGQSVSGIDFNVSATASMNEPSEQQETVASAPDGTPVTFNTWPCGNEDTVTFSSTAGTCYAIGTRATGIAGQVGQARLDRSETTIQLNFGATVLSSNTSRNSLDTDPRSLLLFCETASRPLTVSVSQRQVDACGAGYFYNVFVKAIPSPPPPLITSPTASSQRVATIGLRELFAVYGSGFLPGATVTIGSTLATVDYVEGCSPDFDCTIVVGETPMTLAAGTYNLTVANPSSQTATSASSIVIVPRHDGAIADVTGIHGSLPSYPSNAAALCWGDVDNDGDPDLYRTVNNYTGADAYRLLRNDRIGLHQYSFTDISASIGLAYDFNNPPYSCAFGDVDGDDDIDLVVTFNTEAQQDSVRLYINSFTQTGAVHFANEAGTRGITQSSNDLLARPVFLDFNGDGRLDFFIANNNLSPPYRPNRLYKNLGYGTFTDVAPGTGVDLGSSNARNLDGIVGDFDNDGWADLFLVNFAVSGGHDGRDQLFLNNGHGGFTDATGAWNVGITENCSAAEAADFNNDGWLDIICYLSTVSGPPPKLLLNNNGTSFTDAAGTSGLLGMPPRDCYSIGLPDIDSDGDVDVYLGCQANGDLLLSNNFGQTGLVSFTNATASSGLSSSPNYGPRTDVVTSVDWDLDFDDDIYKTGRYIPTTGLQGWDIVYDGLQSNPEAPTNWLELYTKDSLKVFLRGVVSDIHGIGARMRAVRFLGTGITPTVANCRTVVPPAGEGMNGQMLSDGHNQSPYVVQFNWGDPRDPAYASSVDCLDIFWPSGLRQTLTNLPMHNTVTIVEDSSTTVLRVEPNSGPASGNTPVTIRGIGFKPGAMVYFGTALVTSMVTVSADGTTITCQTPQWQPAGAVVVTVTNPDATADTLEAGFTYTGATGIEVVDPNPSMLVGPVVTSDPVVLTTPGRPVTGMTCDGATQVLLRMQIPPLTYPTTAKVRWFITNEFGVQTTDVGDIFPPGGSPGARTDVTVPVVSFGGNIWSFMLLEAPADGYYLAGNKTRPMLIKAELCDSPTGVCAPGTGVASNRSFDPHYAAIVLQHGIYGTASTFAFKRYALPWKGIQDDDRFFVCAGDYSKVFTQFENSHFQTIADGYWRRDIVDNCLRRLRKERGIAATRVTIVTHSMGTPITRLYVNSPTYLRDENFRKGDIAAFISLDGVHLGAYIMNVAQTLLNGPFGSRVKQISDSLGMPLWTGASEDLTTYSPAIRSLPGTGNIGGTGLNVPAHAIYSTGGSDILYQVAADKLPGLYRFPVMALEAAGYDIGYIFGGSPCQHDATIHISTQQPFQFTDATSKMTNNNNALLPDYALHWTVCTEHQTHLKLRELTINRLDASGGCVECPDWNMSGFPTNVGRPSSDFDQCNPALTLASDSAAVTYSYADTPTNAPEQLNAANPPEDSDISLLLNKNTGTGAVTGTWTDAANGSSYCVCRSLGPGGFDAAYCFKTTVRSFSDPGTLSNGVRYYYRAFDGSSVSCTPAQTGFSLGGASPQSGFPEGGQEVWIIGTGFTSGIQNTVTIGGFPAPCDVPVDQNFMRCFTPAHAVGTVDVRVNGQTMTGAYTYSAQAGGIVVTSPRSGDYVMPGSTITVNVETVDRFPITRVVVGTSAGSYGKIQSGPPWRVKLAIPQAASGTITLLTTALGGASNQHMRIAPEVSLNIDLGGIGLTGITIPGPLSIGANTTNQRLPVNGTYSDGVDRSIAGAAGIAYAVTMPSILTIGSDGVITPVSSGLTDVSATYQGFAAAARVWVSLPLQLGLRRSDNSVSWPGQVDATAYDLVVGDLNLLRSTGGNFATATTDCAVDSTTATSVTSAANPAVGNGFYFLARPVKYGNALSYDDFADWPASKQAASRDAGITGSGRGCP